MTVKTTGAELKRFWNSPIPDGHWFEDEILVVDGKEFDNTQSVLDIADNSIVTLEGGAVINDPKERSVEALFRAWKKRQDTVTLVIEVKRPDEDRVRAALKSLDAKVVGQ